MRLRHCHIPNLIPYAHGEKIQQHLARQLLAYKAAVSSSSSSSSSLSDPPPPPPPDPTILTCEFQPVYTAGRRENHGAVTPAAQARLRAGGAAEFHESPRGGQTTFHGPGQLVAYAVLDLRRHGLSARAHVCGLEGAVVAACGRLGLRGAGRRVDDEGGAGVVGVWVGEGLQRKVASVGVRLRRGVSSHGVGLNVATDLWWFERIVACGLEGKVMTSLEKEGVRGVSVEEAGRVFVEEMARRLQGVDEVVAVSEDELMADAES